MLASPVFGAHLVAELAKENPGKNVFVSPIIHLRSERKRLDTLV